MRRKPTYDHRGKQKTRVTVRWLLAFYDWLAYLAVAIAFLVVYPANGEGLTTLNTALFIFAGSVLIFGLRFMFNVYRQIWRYVSMQAYIRLILADILGGACCLLIRHIPVFPHISVPRTMVLSSMNLLIAISVRILYQYMYQSAFSSPITRALRRMFNLLGGTELHENEWKGVPANRIKVAIIGASQVGVALVEDMMHNPKSSYTPVCFVDSNAHKTGRMVYGLPVFKEGTENVQNQLSECGVQEVVIALPAADADKKMLLYRYYRNMGFRVKVYDYPTMQATGGKRQLREFDIEELLFRKAKEFLSPDVKAYYRDKIILITGGGGSIGSEICRQLAQMQPKQIIVFDVYENNAYDLQQELKISYGDALDVHVEISTMCDPAQLDQIFGHYKPDIVIHAAAHKHVPLCQKNPVEAVKNNVFGTENVLKACEKYGVKRFMMVSTDKAVNPTNVMGATKRMCEMMVLNRPGDMIVSATRFGNVLGSAGSVVPLFRRQIRNGGPITITDKRIIRYFMTIPEASQLVLTSGAMAKNRELFVLDMGRPVRILDLAESMIRLSGLEPYKDIDIVETGLRPGEKLYEELLIKSETLKKTKNEMIFIEQEEPIAYAEIEDKLAKLKWAIGTKNPHEVREMLKVVVPTYHSPEEVNAHAAEADEMRLAN